MTLRPPWFLLVSTLGAVLACIAFLPGLPGSFILDDAYTIVSNSRIQLKELNVATLLDAALSKQPGGATRILPAVMFALDYYRGGLAPETFKTTNIAIHGVTAIVLVWLLRDLLLIAGVAARRAPWLALALALAWALHPLQVSSVLYAAQRMQTMGTLFLILALWSYLRARQAQIDARPARTGLILVGLCWALALACKEDSIILPGYLLAVELTILQFRSADASLTRNLRRTCLLAAFLGVAVFLLYVVPKFWSWDHYPNRDFSSIERLLTQGRVLCMYLGQILLPLPSRMPFFYDWLQPSRSLVSPLSTLPAIAILFSLVATAWKLRSKRPLFSFGVLFFFVGHFVSSNVIGLELAFEHRNHLPMLGILIALGDLIERFLLEGRQRTLAILFACTLLAALGTGTYIRAESWNSGLRFALTATRNAPQSARAWQTLCVTWYELGGERRPDNPHLGKAIAACEKGVEVAPDSIPNLTNVIVLKAIAGSLTESDWDRYMERLQDAPMTLESTTRIWLIIDQVRNDVPINIDRVFDAIDLFHQRAPFRPLESTAIGYFILGYGGGADRAFPYFARAVERTPDASFASSIVADVRKEGYAGLADRLETIRAARVSHQ